MTRRVPMLLAKLANALLLLAAMGATSTDAVGQIFGANYNERGRDANVAMFAPSQTSWSRGFFNVPGMLGVTNLADNVDIAGMRRAADGGNELMVSFKWNFLGNGNQRVPAPGSSEELNYFNRAVQTLQAIGRPVNTIVLGNEPQIETVTADLNFTAGATPYVPYVRFTERLLDYVNTNFGAQQATTPRYFVGSLIRLDQSGNQNSPLTQELFRVARENPLLAGMDLHVHFPSMTAARSMVQFGRNQLGPDKDLVITEFSPVHIYQDHLNDAIGATPAGAQFAQQYGYAPTLQVDEYLKDAFATQVTRQEWTDFIVSQPWYNERHVRDMRDLFNEFDVSIATIGFTQPLSMRGLDPTVPGYAPFQINWLYIAALVGGPILEAYNEPYLEDWLEAQKALADVNRDGTINVIDYALLHKNTSTDFAQLSFTQSLKLGDLNLDRHVDAKDFTRFDTLYQLEHGVPLDVVGSADIDSNSLLDGHDWEILNTNLGMSLSTAGVDAALWKSYGDLDLSGAIDRMDFRLFKSAYEVVHGAPSLQLLIDPADFAVPEPLILTQLVGALLFGSQVDWARRRRKNQRRN